MEQENNAIINTNDVPVPGKSRKGLAVTSLILGLVSIVTALIWFLSLPLAITAIISGIAALKGSGRSLAIAGVVTGVLGLVASVLVVVLVFSGALGELQSNQSDSQLKNDVSRIVSDVNDFQTNNTGKLPKVSDLSTTSLTKVESISGSAEASNTTAVYLTGKNCEGETSARDFSVIVLLGDDTEYCLGS